MRNAAIVLLALLFVLPVAEARMTVTPRSVEVRAGGTAEFRVNLLNVADHAITYEVETSDPGLAVTFDRSQATLGAGEDVTFIGTVRAAPWAAGEKHVTIHLLENGEEIETRDLPVRVETSVTAAATTGAIGGLSVGAALAFVAWRRWHLVALALYSRIQRENLERHPSRARLVEIARATPGISLADAQRAAGLANGPFEHHLGKLVASGRLVVVEHGRARLLRLAESGPVAAPPGTARRIAERVHERGVVRAADLARELGLSRQALHYHVRALSRDGVVAARLEGGRLVLARG